jgi:branched-chain amino acid transport system permease protein
MRRYRLLAEAAARRLWPLASLSLLLVVAVIAIKGLSETHQRVATLGLIDLVIVIGLYIFVGNSGILSFGHIAFVAIGAYTSALLTVPPLQKDLFLPGVPEYIATAEWPSIPAALMAAGVAAAFAFLISIPLMRLSGLAAGIATLAVLVIVYVVISHWDSVTGGQTTLVGIPTDSTLNVALVWALIAMAVAFAFQESRIGRRLRASSEDEAAARAVGIGVVRERIAAFVLSAAVAGLGGALYGHYLGAFSPDAFYFQITFLIVTMLVVGGVRSLAGAVVGTAFVTVFAEALRNAESGIDAGPVSIAARPGLREVGLGVVLLLILVVRPRGITGGREVHWPLGKWMPRREAADPDPEQSTLSSEAARG